MQLYTSIIFVDEIQTFLIENENENENDCGITNLKGKNK